MSSGVRDSKNVEIPNIKVLACRTTPQVNAMNHRTLGGLWFTQVVGTPAIKAEVELYATGMLARDSILDFYATGAAMIIEYDGYIRTGYIIEAPSAELGLRARNPEHRIFIVKFMFGVDIEVPT